MSLLPGLLLACNETLPPAPVTEIGNPERSVGVSALPAPSLAVTSAWVSLGPTTLGTADGDSADTPDLVADLLQGPFVLKFRSPDGDYDQLVVRPTPTEDPPPDAPHDLAGNSLVVDGTRDDGVPFHLVSSASDELALSGDFALADDQRDLALGFSTDAWFAGIDLYSATETHTGIAIDATQNPELLAAFDASLASSIALAEDLDGDGQVGPHDAVLVSGDPYHH